MPQRNAKAFMVERQNYDENGHAGACSFVSYADDTLHTSVGVRHKCPCGCGSLSTLYFKGGGRGAPEWDVIGEWPNVTLTPSIGIRRGNRDAPDGDLRPDGFHWHGYLKDGTFEELP